MLERDHMLCLYPACHALESLSIIIVANSWLVLFDLIQGESHIPTLHSNCCSVVLEGMLQTATECTGLTCCSYSLLWMLLI